MPTAEEAAELPPLKPISSRSILIEEPECLLSDSGLETGLQDLDQDSRTSLSPKKHRTNSSRRLSGRLAYDRVSPSLNSLSSLSSIGSSTTLEPRELGTPGGGLPSSHPVRHQHASHIISQVVEWLHTEKAKKAAARAGKHGKSKAKIAHAAEASRSLLDHVRSHESKNHTNHISRTDSDLTDESLALERLEHILSKSISLGEDDLAVPAQDQKGPVPTRRASKSKPIRQPSRKLLRKGSTIASSDNEYQEPDIDVPSAEVILDNSKTLSYSGGLAASETNVSDPNKRAMRERDAWLQFKHEIVRLTHTLRLRGWRRLPLANSEDIDVERLSGALTNAVYVVSPPSHLPQTPSMGQESTTSLVPRKPPSKLLLRIYGPQVEHLIDRESELQILRRLARKRIGPRLLGTFTNGRFEQFFHARTLTARDIRMPEISKHIAKRMRELHDGIELLEEERDEGAFVWRNWDKWKNRCEEVISYLDNQILSSKQELVRSRGEDWKQRGLVCGVEWSVFRAAVRKYRDWLYDQYGGAAGLREQLVFAHNDTQYGNLLRIEPSGESPLLLPANEHKQLIVIDFEYASANVPGLEFANHFTEWCYNYHNPKPYVLNASAYPTQEEQHRFLKAYIQHVPPIQTRPSMSPRGVSRPGLTSSISSFMLDSRAPPAQIADEEKQRTEALDSDIARLSTETRMWRVANSAMWVAWGIVQAKVPGMDEALEAAKNATPKAEQHDGQEDQPHPQGELGSDPLTSETTQLVQDAHDKRPEEGEGQDDEEEEEFDYLGYAQERAMFFWGDVLQLGIVKREDLPKELLQKVKVVEY